MYRCSRFWTRKLRCVWNVLPLTCRDEVHVLTHSVEQQPLKADWQTQTTGMTHCHCIRERLHLNTPLFLRLPQCIESSSFLKICLSFCLCCRVSRCCNGPTSVCVSQGFHVRRNQSWSVRDFNLPTFLSCVKCVKTTKVVEICCFRCQKDMGHHPGSCF